MADIVIPLDVPDLATALALVDRLGEGADFYKVGLELHTAEGPTAVRELRERGKRVFLDLKLHDIPTTVAGSVASAARSGAELLTLHAGGGRRMMEAAVDAAADAGVRLLAVTLLTSLSVDEIEETWGRSIRSVRDEVVRLAEAAAAAGVTGAVASPLEVAALRRRLGPGFLLVTPGIRLEEGDRHDQARVATPVEAVRSGSDVLVIGRAVTASDDPAGTLARIRAAIEGVE